MIEGSDLKEKLENLKRLNRNRWDYVLKRSSSKSIVEALAAAKMSDTWYYRFTQDEREELERLADELHYEKAIQAELILADAAPEAARVKVSGLKSRDPKIQQTSATEVLDRTIGKPGENNKTKVEGTINFIWSRNQKPSGQN